MTSKKEENLQNKFMHQVVVEFTLIDGSGHLHGVSIQLESNEKCVSSKVAIAELRKKWQKRFKSALTWKVGRITQKSGLIL